MNNKEDELAKNALIEIAKIIIETENKYMPNIYSTINSSIDDDFSKLLNNISDEFDVGIGAELLKEVENSIIFTNSLGEIFFEGDKCYHKCRRETTYHHLNEIATYNAKKGYCEKDAFFSEIFKKKIECEIYG